MKMNLVVLMLLASMSGCDCQTVEPGQRAVLVDLGQIQEPLKGEGWHFGCFLAMTCDFHVVSIRTQKEILSAPCFTSDLQQVTMKFVVLYRIPEAQVINVYRQYHGDPFSILVLPRAQEAVKEVSANKTAEHMVKDREAVKSQALAALQSKIGDTVIIEDLVIEDIELSKELSQAIEQKMIQEQEAAKAKFTKLKAEIDAEIATARAKGEADASLLKAKAEAEAIRIRGDALQKNPGVLQLTLIEKWNGESPRIISGASGGVSLLLPAAESK